MKLKQFQHFKLLSFPSCALNQFPISSNSSAFITPAPLSHTISHNILLAHPGLCSNPHHLDWIPICFAIADVSFKLQLNGLIPPPLDPGPRAR